MQRFGRFTVMTSLMIAMLVVFTGTILSQAPPPNLSLIPVVLISISLDDFTRPVNTPTGHGTVSVTGNPPVNSLLRAPNNKVALRYALPELHPDRFYQVLFEGVEIIGVCSDRVVQ